MSASRVSSLARLCRAGLLSTLCAAGCGAPPDPSPPDPNPPVPGTSKLGLADVSVLFPLPAPGVTPELLALDAPGRGGPLLSHAVFDAIPVFSDNPQPERAYEHWRVVAARIDPCFPDLAQLESNPSACRRQVRLVAQPFAPQAGGAQDNAIHLLYDLTESDFRAFAEAWVAVRTARSSDYQRPLGVHPELEAQGLGGAVGSEFRRLILAHAGPDTLSQVTFMEGRFAAWEFGGFRVQGGQPSALQIFGLPTDAKTQTTTADLDGVFDFTPRSDVGNTLHALAGEQVPFGGTGGTQARLTASAAAVNAALKESLRVDNPRALNPDTVDCSACHAAGRARERALHLGADATGLEPFTLKGFNLSIEPLGDIRPRLTEQRAFGYHDGYPVWNQRTVNESAAVAQALSNLLLGTVDP